MLDGLARRDSMSKSRSRCRRAAPARVRERAPPRSARVAREDASRPSAAPLRPAHEEHLARRQRAQLRAQVRLHLGRERRCRRRRRAPRAPRYSTRSQWSTRLAVAVERLAVGPRDLRAEGYAAAPRSLGGDDADHLARSSPARPAATDEVAHDAVRGARAISFSIFIASTMQRTWPALDRVALGDLDREHRALHRADDRVRAPPPRPAGARARAGGARAPRTAARARAPHVEAAAVDLDARRALRSRRRAVGAAPRGRCASSSAARCAASSPTRRRRGRSRRRRSTDARAARGGSRAASATPSITNSSSARSIRRRACSRSTPWTISFAIIGS